MVWRTSPSCSANSPATAALSRCTAKSPTPTQSHKLFWRVSLRCRPLCGRWEDAMIAFDKNICGQLNQAAQREWLETNGIGGFASSTIVGMNTRRYHGLLVASLKPPVERCVLLSKLEETLLVDGVAHELSVNQYPGAIHPQGYQYLKAFRLDPFPVFRFRQNGSAYRISEFWGSDETRSSCSIAWVAITDAPGNGSYSSIP